MSPYREPEPPVLTDRVITLRPADFGRYSVRNLLWSLGATAYLWLVQSFLVEPLAEDPSWWRLSLCLVAWLLLPFAMLRSIACGTLRIGAETLQQVGLLRTHHVRWSDVSAVEYATKVGPLGSGPSIRLRSSDGTLQVPEFGILDPEGTLDWAIDAAVEGRTRDIAERVEREGGHAWGLQRGWFAVGAMLLVLGILGAYRYREAQRDLERRIVSEIYPSDFLLSGQLSEPGCPDMTDGEDLDVRDHH